MFGVIVNTFAVMIGSLCGLLLKKGIPAHISSALMTGIALCTIYIGIDGSLSGENPLILIFSVCIGVIIGELLRLEDRLAALSSSIENRFQKKDGQTSIAQGFMTASLLFCVGSMTIVGSLQAGIAGDHTMLITKSTLDLISSFALASSLGIGVLCAAAFVFVFQGSLVLLAQYIAPFFTDAVISEVTCVGSVIIIALGLNLLGLTKIKCANLLPAIFLPILFCMFL